MTPYACMSHYCNHHFITKVTFQLTQFFQQHSHANLHTQPCAQSRAEALIGLIDFAFPCPFNTISAFVARHSIHSLSCVLFSSYSSVFPFGLVQITWVVVGKKRTRDSTKEQPVEYRKKLDQHRLLCCSLEYFSP